MKNRILVYHMANEKHVWVVELEMNNNSDYSSNS